MGGLLSSRKSLDFFACLRWKILNDTSSTRLLRVLGMPLICLALFAFAGGHWAVLQAIAWAQIHTRRFSTASISNYQELVSEFFTKSPAIAQSLLREREGKIAVCC
jgi:hypothetical protein